jgi:phage shock protein C
MNDRLYRSRDDRMIAGVAGGLAERWDADPSLIRIIWAFLVILTGGIALVVYVVMALVVPESDAVPGSGRATARASRLETREARRAERRARRAGRPPSAFSPALVFGAILILVGGAFLARQWWPQLRFDWFWPAVLIGLGLLLVVGALGRGQEGRASQDDPPWPDAPPPPAPESSSAPTQPASGSTQPPAPPRPPGAGA